MVLRGLFLIFACLLLCQAAAFGGVVQMVSICTWSGPGSGEEGWDSSIGARISPDGRFVVFSSWARNLADGDTYRMWDVFVHNRVTRTNELVSLVSADAWGCHASDDGRYVAFATMTDPGDTAVLVCDRLTGATEQVVSRTQVVPEEGFAFCGMARISADGRYVSYYSETWDDVVDDRPVNADCSVFVYDRITGTTERVSVGSGGQWENYSGCAWISGDGRYVTFESCATNLVPGDTNGELDVFVRDRIAGTTELVSVTASGQSGNRESFATVISPDGRYLLFGSRASDLVPGDTNGYHDGLYHPEIAVTRDQMAVYVARAFGLAW
jgi:Tol biopolymer transport system component